MGMCRGGALPGDRISSSSSRLSSSGLLAQTFGVTCGERRLTSGSNLKINDLTTQSAHI